MSLLIEATKFKEDVRKEVLSFEFARVPVHLAYFSDSS